MSFTYLASPYSDPNPEVMEQRFYAVMKKTAQMILVGDRTVYSPIVHFHELAGKHKLPTDADWWFNHNLNMLRAAQVLVVLKLPGWEDSKGVRGEIEFAKSVGIHVSYSEVV